MTAPVFQVGQQAPRPLDPRTEADILAHWDSDKPVVSILCATYNHEEFIDDAMKGFLGQVTSFAFEVIVRDDASTDGTLDILRRWESLYPRIVRVIAEETNTYATDKPFDVLRPHAKGEFVAICEGDDYWIDPGKLQAQVDYLKRRPNAVLCHHQAVGVTKGHITHSTVLALRHARDLAGRALQRGGAAVTGSILHRNVPFEPHPYLSRIWNGDQILLMLAGAVGDAVFLPGPPRSVYRIHQTGVWSGTAESERAIKSAESFYWIAQWFADRGEFASAAYSLRRSVLALVKGFSFPLWKRMRPFPLMLRLGSLFGFRRSLEFFQRVTR
jgi:glycosyltransferase involved in cell wall biosynthesis